MLECLVAWSGSEGILTICMCPEKCSSRRQPEMVGNVAMGAQRSSMQP